MNRIRALMVAATSIAAITASASAFESFETESIAVSSAISCPSPKVTKTEGLPDLWGCILAPNEVAKVFINADTSGGVADVKVMWNDWTKDVGYGVHTDRAAAEAWLAALAMRYAPASVDEVLEAYRGVVDTKIEGDGHLLSYTYFKGPAIDERLVTITPSAAP